MDSQEIKNLLENYTVQESKTLELPLVDPATKVMDNLFIGKTDPINKIEYKQSKSYSKVVGYVKEQD